MSTAITIAVGVILLLFLIDGIRRGFLRSMLEIVGLAVAFILARKYGPELASSAASKTSFSQTALVYVLSIAVFICVIIAFHLFGLLMQKIVSATVLSPVDRLGGALLGILKGVLIVSLLITVVYWLPLPASFKADVRSNPVAEVLGPVLPGLYDFVVDRVCSGRGESRSSKPMDRKSDEELHRRRSVSL